MRLHMTGSGQPIQVWYTAPGTFAFDKTEYVAKGYTSFEVAVIGGAGGFGGTEWDTATDYWVGGGGGGGGGLHRVLGSLASLSTSTVVVVGAHGLNGENAAPPSLGTNGQPGQASTFGGSIARASGGLGGVCGRYATLTPGIGGRGGSGGTTAAGGGPPRESGHGTFNGTVGYGGCGGAGPMGVYSSSTADVNPQSGRGGSYHSIGVAWFATGEPVVYEEWQGYGGAGGGARVGFPGAESPLRYGSSYGLRGPSSQSSDGAVAILVT